MNRLFGDDPMSRWEDALEIYETSGTKVRFLLLNGIGYDRKALQHYSTEFIKEVLNNE